MIVICKSWKGSNNVVCQEERSCSLAADGGLAFSKMISVCHREFIALLLHL